MTWRQHISSSGSDGVDWKIETDEQERGRFRITYSTHDGKRRTRSTLDLGARLERKYGTTSMDAERES